MTTRSRLLLGFASLLLLAMYFAPLWQITLEAPQYPEGLGLRIHLSTIDGMKQHDLQNINNLNHYIGMKRIEPDAIPELRIMPWVIAFLVGFGLIAAVFGRVWMLYAWTALFLILAVAGLVDFYLWAYDYGHDLDIENAAIKVPGMTYQPPIIGSKKLLNFTAHSWPGIGGWAAFASLGIGVLLCLERWSTRTSRRMAPAAGVVLAVLMLGGCGEPAPEPFAFDQDQDAFCRMTISDARFATQVVSRQGRAYKFDSVECMRGFLGAGSLAEGDIHSIWVTDAASRTLISADSAIFVHGERIQSPMGGGLIAFASRADAGRFATEQGGQELSWATVLDQPAGIAAGHSGMH